MAKWSAASGSRTRTQSPIPVLTGLDVEWLRWYDQRRYHYATLMHRSLLLFPFPHSRMGVRIHFPPVMTVCCIHSCSVWGVCSALRHDMQMWRTDGQTDSHRHTSPWQLRRCACRSASRSKKWTKRDEASRESVGVHYAWPWSADDDVTSWRHGSISNIRLP